MFHPIGSKATLAAFGWDNRQIITGHESGKVAIFDAKTGDEIQTNEKAHHEPVTDLQLSADRSYFITSSKDKSARVRRVFLFDSYWALS
jgi:translation initiation factor 3 subunit I